MVQKEMVKVMDDTTTTTIGHAHRGKIGLGEW